MKRVFSAVYGYLRDTDKLYYALCLSCTALSVVLLLGMYEAGFFTRMRLVYTQLLAAGIGLLGAVIDLTVEAMKKALISAFEQVYGLPSLPFPVEELDGDKTAALAARNASFDWRLGRNIPFHWQGECRFPWGGIELIDQFPEAGILHLPLLCGHQQR